MRIESWRNNVFLFFFLKKNGVSEMRIFSSHLKFGLNMKLSKKTGTSRIGFFFKKRICRNQIWSHVYATYGDSQVTLELPLFTFFLIFYMSQWAATYGRIKVKPASHPPRRTSLPRTLFPWSLSACVSAMNMLTGTGENLEGSAT